MHAYQAPRWDQVGRTQASIYHPRCAPAGKVIQHFCVSRFFPREGTGLAAHLYGGACARVRTRTALQLASSLQPSTQGAVEAVLPPCPEESTQGRISLFEAELWPEWSAPREAQVPPPLSPLWPSDCAVGTQCEAGGCRYLAAYKTAA